MKKIIFVILILIILLGCNGHKGTGASAIKITNPIKKCKMVDVPYTAIEEYQVPFKYEMVAGSKGTTLRGLDVWAKGTVNVRNVDSETGSFTVEQTFRTLNRGSQTLKSTQYIMSGETKSFVELFDISLGEDFKVSYRIIPPEKTLTKTVTKYRKEERCD